VKAKLIFSILLCLFLASCTPQVRVTAWDLVPTAIIGMDLVEKREVRVRFAGEIRAVVSIFSPDPSFFPQIRKKGIAAGVREFVSPKYVEEIWKDVPPSVYVYELRGEKVQGFWVPQRSYRLESIWKGRFLLVAEAFGDRSETREACRGVLLALLGAFNILQPQERF